MNDWATKSLAGHHELQDLQSDVNQHHACCCALESGIQIVRRFLIALLLWPTLALGQFSIPAHTGAKAATGSAVTVYLGGTAAINSARGNQNYGFCTPIKPAYNFAVSSIGLYWAVAGSGTWGTAIYADNGGTPVGGARLYYATTSSSPSVGYNTLTPSGVGTLTAGTVYWLCGTTASSTSDPASSGYASDSGSNNCPEGLSSVFTSAVLASPFTTWPTTWPASTASGSCEAIYAAGTYATAQTYTNVQVGGGFTSAVQATSTFNIPAITASDQSLLVAISYGGGTYTPSSVVDAINGTTTDTLTERGTCGTGASGIVLTNCFFTIDRVTSGVNSFTVTFPAGLHFGVAYTVIAGTASPSFDQVHYDTAVTSTPFTSGSTGKTAQATEYLFGAATTSIAMPATFAGSSGWSNLQNTGQDGNTSYGFGIFGETVTNGPATYDLTGTQGRSGPYNVLSLITVR